MADAALREGRGGVTTRITALYARGTWRWVADGSRKPVTCCRSRCRSASHPATSCACRCRFGASPRRRWSAGGSMMRSPSPRGGGTVSAAVDDAASWRRSSSRAPAPGSPRTGSGRRRLGRRRWRHPASSGIATLRPPIDHAHGLARARARRDGPGQDAPRRRRDGWDRIGRVWEGTWARLDLASCHLRSRRPQERRSSLPMRARSPTRWAAGPSRIAPASCSAMRAAGPGPPIVGATDGPRIRRRAPDRGRTDQRRDRRRADNRPQDRGIARRAHPGQAHGDEADRDRGLGKPPRRRIRWAHAGTSRASMMCG